MSGPKQSRDELVGQGVWQKTSAVASFADGAIDGGAFAVGEGGRGGCGDTLGVKWSGVRSVEVGHGGRLVQAAAGAAESLTAANT